MIAQYIQKLGFVFRRLVASLKSKSGIARNVYILGKFLSTLMHWAEEDALFILGSKFELDSRRQKFQVRRPWSRERCLSLQNCLALKLRQSGEKIARCLDWSGLRISQCDCRAESSEWVRASFRMKVSGSLLQSSAPVLACKCIEAPTA